MFAPNPHTKKPRGLAHAKPVKAVGFRGKVFGVFPSVHTAAEAMGLWRNSLITAIRNGNRAAGYYWRLVDVPDEQQPLNPRDRRDHDERQPIPLQYTPGGIPKPKPPPPEPVTKVYAPRGTVVRGCAFTFPAPVPSRLRSARLSEKDTGTGDAIDSVGSIDPDPVDGEVLNPHRLGRRAPTREDEERGRWAQARRYNPGLTWEAWQVITTKAPRGRKPGAKVTKASPGAPDGRGEKQL